MLTLSKYISRSPAAGSNLANTSPIPCDIHLILFQLQPLVQMDRRTRCRQSPRVLPASKIQVCCPVPSKMACNKASKEMRIVQARPDTVENTFSTGLALETLVEQVRAELSSPSVQPQKKAHQQKTLNRCLPRSSGYRCCCHCCPLPMLMQTPCQKCKLQVLGRVHLPKPNPSAATTRGDSVPMASAGLRTPVAGNCAGNLKFHLIIITIVPNGPN
jgi:hypothetical protein